MTRPPPLLRSVLGPGRPDSAAGLAQTLLLATVPVVLLRMMMTPDEITEMALEFQIAHFVLPNMFRNSPLARVRVRLRARERPFPARFK